MLGGKSGNINDLYSVAPENYFAFRGLALSLLGRKTGLSVFAFPQESSYISYARVDSLDYIHINI